jgi:hypothetical protein
MQMTTRTRLILGFTIGTALSSGAFVFTTADAQRPEPTSPLATQTAGPQGQTATLLPDGRWLLLGGETSGGVSRAAAIVDPSTGTTSVLGTSMMVARAGHTATVLPDGTVLIVGGREAFGQLAGVAELFDPDSGAFMPIAFEGGTARAGHSATLLSDGRVLVAGGTAAGDRVTSDLEMWDVRAQHVVVAGRLRAPRSGQTATLLEDGRVALSAGVDAGGRPVTRS